MLTWCFFISLLVVGSHQLKPNGVHVCSRTVSYNVYIAATTTRIGYDSYRTCCRRVLGACVDRCTRYRTRVLSVSKSVLQIRHKPVYYCCPGWSKRWEECPIPICNPGCVHGKCVNPNTCKCNPQYQGPRCNVPICNPGCVHGKCILPNTCKCIPEYEGPLCKVPICNPGCVHGKCVLPNTCKCNPQYQGPRCNVVKKLLVCKQDHMTLLLNKDNYPQNEKQVISMVNEQTCKGETNKTFISIATKYDQCGTRMTEDRDSITYTNAALLILGNEDGEGGDLVSRKRNITFDLVCEHKRMVNTSSASFKPINATVTTNEDGFGSFTISMSVLKSASYSNGYSADDYPITVKFSDRVYMAMKLTSEKKDLRLLLQNCHATPNPDPLAKPRFDIVTERCPNDDTFQLHDQQDSQLQFSIVAFQFLEASDGIYIHCEASICKGISNDPRCAFGCQKNRKRRDLSEPKISKSYSVSSGYIKISKDTKKEKPPFLKSTAGYVVVGTAMFVVFALLLLATIKVTKSRKSKGNK